MFVKFMTGSSRFNSMLKEAEKASNKSKSTIKTKDKVIYQVTSDSIIDALGKRGSYAISYIPIQKRTSLFGKPLSKEKCFVIEESGHPEKISKIFRAHEIGHLEANHLVLGSFHMKWKLTEKWLKCMERKLLSELFNTYRIPLDIIS